MSAPRPIGAGDLVQHSRTMRIPLKLSFRGLCGEYSVKPGIKSKVAIHLRTSEKEHRFLTYNGISRTTFLEYLTMKTQNQSKING
jgi:hypothetical protein